MLIESFKNNIATINFYGKGSFCHAKREVQNDIVKEQDVLFLKQIHSNNVHIVNDNYNIHKIEADALITNNKGISLGVITADCMPILLVDTEASIIAAVHVGWRGANTNIISKSIKEMMNLGANSEKIIAYIGPCIRVKNYQVSNDFSKNFNDINSDNANLFFPKINGRLHFNLPEYSKYQLENSGVIQIHDCMIDTYENHNILHSHRRGFHNNTEVGRQISVVTIG